MHQDGSREERTSHNSFQPHFPSFSDPDHPKLRLGRPHADINRLANAHPALNAPKHHAAGAHIGHQSRS